MVRWWIPLLLCACGGASPATTLFVATARDGDDDVSIALLTDGERVVAYACADDVARDPYPGWFSGDVAPDGTFALTLGDWSLSGSIGSTGARGAIVEPDGTVVSWSTAAISHAPLTGLYKNDSGDSCGASVIVIADDPTQPPIVRGASCNVMQVTPVAPIALVDGELGVDVATSEAPVRVYVAPVRTIPP